MKKFKFKKKIKLIESYNLNKIQLNNDSINLLNVKLDLPKKKIKFFNKSNHYIKECFDLAFKY